MLAREIMGKHPEAKEKLWGGEFWSDGYFVSTVSKYGNEEVIKNYVKKQGTEKEHTEIYKKQLELFD
jgi:REP element-mobilizing transposase RayT